MDNSIFITGVRVKDVFNLSDVDIPIGKSEKKHLIITGKNGSGKSAIVNAMLEGLQMLIGDSMASHPNGKTYKYRSDKYLTTLHRDGNEPIVLDRIFLDEGKSGDFIEEHYVNPEAKSVSWITFFGINDDADSVDIIGGVNISFNNSANILKLYNSDDFVIAFYGSKRNLNIPNINSPEKPNWDNVRQIKTDGNSELLKFLVNCKVNESFARNEGNIIYADRIKDWFNGFESLLKRIFQDKDLKLQFEYKDYSFTINSNGNKSPLTKLSDGYSAVIEIVSDLIMKMQLNRDFTPIYEKQGIVIIDEVETHLHLELQKLILPILTTIFPNIQFIVTTHSPFVLNSIDNAVAFDLEKRKPIEELTEYSYEALAEGYFGISTESSYIRMKLDRLKGLLEKECRNNSEEEEIKSIKSDFDKMPESFSPQIKGEYMQIMSSSKRGLMQ